MVTPLNWLVGFTGFASMAAFWPHWVNGATQPRWAALAVLVPILLICLERPKWQLPHVLLLMFFGWCVVTLIWASSYLDGVAALVVLSLFSLSFLVGSSLQSIRPLFIGLALGMFINAPLALDQLFDWPITKLIGLWEPWGEFAPPAGLFSNRNSLAEIAALIAIGCVVYRLWWGLPCCVLALCTSWSRTALLMLAVAGLYWLYINHRKIFIVAFASLLVASPFILKVHPMSVNDRVLIWSNTATGLTPFGAGVGSFHQDYPKLSKQQTLSMRPDNAHNDYLEILYETGVPGLVLFLALLAVTLWNTTAPERYLLLALMLEASFAFPLHLPVTLFLFGLISGRCVGSGAVYSLHDLHRRGTTFRRAARSKPKFYEGSGICQPIFARVSKRTGKIGVRDISDNRSVARITMGIG